MYPHLTSIYAQKSRHSIISLSSREKQCLFYLLYGRTAKMIAKLLSLSPRTVEYYIENIKSKLGCRTKAELIDKVITEGYLERLPGLSASRTFSRALKA